MNFTDWIASTLGTTAVISVLVAILVYLSKNWFVERLKNSIKHEYDKELEQHKAVLAHQLETHKADLKRDYDVQVEQLKAQLQIANVRFSHIYVKQAEAIAETYVKLLPLLDAVEDYSHIQSSDESDMNKKIQALNTASSTFFSFYRTVKIYIPKPTAKRLTDFTNTVLDIARIYNRYEMVTLLQRHGSVPEEREVLGKFAKQIDELKANVTPLLAELESDFQTLLGVHMEEKRN